jgi:hypothetical protein
MYAFHVYGMRNAFNHAQVLLVEMSSHELFAHAGLNLIFQVFISQVA